mgnify:CR=1 FL=1
MVKSIPWLPDANALLTFIPNPSPMTEYCSSFFDMVLLNVGNALPNSRAKANPKANATGDDTQWATQENGPRLRVNTSSTNPKTKDTPISATMPM